MISQVKKKSVMDSLKVLAIFGFLCYVEVRQQRLLSRRFNVLLSKKSKLPFLDLELEFKKEEKDKDENYERIRPAGKRIREVDFNKNCIFWLTTNISYPRFDLNTFDSSGSYRIIEIIQTTTIKEHGEILLVVCLKRSHKRFWLILRFNVKTNAWVIKNVIWKRLITMIPFHHFVFNSKWALTIDNWYELSFLNLLMSDEEQRNTEINPFTSGSNSCRSFRFDWVQDHIVKPWLTETHLYLTSAQNDDYYLYLSPQKLNK